MKRHNDPFYNMEQLDNQAQSWVEDYASVLTQARTKLLLSLLGLSFAVVAVQGASKLILKAHPVRPAIQTVVYGSAAGVFAALTNLLRIRKETDRGWTNLQRTHVEMREDFVQKLGERNYMPYSDEEGDGIQPARLSDE